MSQRGGIGRRLAAAFAVVAVCIAPAPSRAQSVIELRGAARVPAGEAVRLADVASLQGAEAEALAEVAILSASQRAGAITVTIDHVRQAVQQNERANWGRITLRGSECHLLGPAPASPRGEAPPPDPRPANTTGTVRAAAAARIAQILRAIPADLRLTFAPDDDQFLNLPTAGRRLELRTTAASDRLPLAITIYEGERIVSARTIRVGVEVRRPVLLARAPKRRGETIESGEVAVETQWLGLTGTPATMDQVAGAAVRTRLASGQVIMADDVTPPVVVSKGDHVTIHCLSGGVVLTTRARALGPGRDGEVIEFQAMDSKRTFAARITGKGRAVVAADAQEPIR